MRETCVAFVDAGYVSDDDYSPPPPQKKRAPAISSTEKKHGGGGSSRDRGGGGDVSSVANVLKGLTQVIKYVDTTPCV